jgi:hypothetical protein
MALFASEVIPSKKSAVSSTSVDSAWKDLARCTRSTRCSSYFTLIVLDKGMHQRVFVDQGIHSQSSLLPTLLGPANTIYAARSTSVV